MTTYRAKSKERLDQIIYRHYGTLDMNTMNAVFEANPEKLEKIELEADEIIYIPTIDPETIETKSRALW